MILQKFLIFKTHLELISTKIFFPKADKIVWSSSITTLPSDKNKEEFDKKSVLENRSSIKDLV